MVEFNLLEGVRGVKGVALDVATAAATMANFQQQMMRRFKFMEDMRVNNIHKIKNTEVDYFTVFGETVQFDELYRLEIDLDKKARDYEKLKMMYPDERQPLIITIEEIYEGMQSGRWRGRHPKLPEVKGYNSYLSPETITKTRGIFFPKAMIFLADELNELMNADDYKSVETFKQNMGSVARLGRAAEVHLCLACQRAGGGTINADLKNNIQMCVLLGDFDDSASNLMFEKDISNLAKPEIKGRAFAKVGSEIIEVQTYFTKPENDWVFDENRADTYRNPEFLKQCKLRDRDVDAINVGWVDQVPFEDGPDPSEEDEDDDDRDDRFGRYDDFDGGGFRDGMPKRRSPVRSSSMSRPMSKQPEMMLKFGEDEPKDEKPFVVPTPSVPTESVASVPTVEPSVELSINEAEHDEAEVSVSPNPVGENTLKINIKKNPKHGIKIRLNTDDSTTSDDKNPT